MTTSEKIIALEKSIESPTTPKEFIPQLQEKLNQLKFLQESENKNPNLQKPKKSQKLKTEAKKYYAHRNIKTVTVIEDGQKVTYPGNAVLNGLHYFDKGRLLDKIATYHPVRSIVEVELEDGTKLKPVNGYYIKDSARPIAEKGAILESEIIDMPNFDLEDFLQKMQPLVAKVFEENGMALSPGYKITKDGKNYYGTPLLYKEDNVPTSVVVGYWKDNDIKLDSIGEIEFEIPEKEFHVRFPSFKINKVELYAKGGWTNDHNQLNKGEDYEVRYNEKHPRKLGKGAELDKIGRLAKGKTLEQIAKMHNVKLDYIEKQMNRGEKVEMEHTTDVNIARAIAKDHIFENPDYYILLSKVENKPKISSFEKKERAEYLKTKDKSSIQKWQDVIALFETFAKKNHIDFKKINSFQEIQDQLKKQDATKEIKLNSEAYFFSKFENVSFEDLKKEFLNTPKSELKSLSTSVKIPNLKGREIKISYEGEPNGDKIKKIVGYRITPANFVKKDLFLTIDPKYADEVIPEKLWKDFLSRKEILVKSGSGYIGITLLKKTARVKNPNKKGNPIFELARKIRKPGQNWQAAVKEATEQLRNK